MLNLVRAKGAAPRDRDLLRHPAFASFADLLLPWDDRAHDARMPPAEIGSLLPYHSHVDPETVTRALKRMIDDVGAGKAVFHRFYVMERRVAALRRLGSEVEYGTIPGSASSRARTIYPGCYFPKTSSTWPSFSRDLPRASGPSPRPPTRASPRIVILDASVTSAMRSGFARVLAAALLPASPPEDPPSTEQEDEKDDDEESSRRHG